MYFEYNLFFFFLNINLTYHKLSLQEGAGSCFIVYNAMFLIFFHFFFSTTEQSNSFFAIVKLDPQNQELILFSRHILFFY